MSLLHTVARDINRTLISHVPPHSPHFAWRVHPDDWRQLSYELSEQHRLAGNAHTVRNIVVMGLRVFPDDTVPKIK